MATSLLSGAAFGAALLAAGVYKPNVILSQVKLENYHMIQAFLAATASSTLVVYLLDKLNIVPHCKPRSAAPLGIFSRFDGNIIGGTLLGAGMALSGACPGTALVQASVGIRSGWYALDGAILAGIAWVGFLGPIVEKRRRKASAGEPVAVYEHVGISRTAALVAFEAMCIAVIAGTIAYTPPSPYKPFVAPFLGGLLIGGAQLFSLLSRGCLVGVSTMYEDVGKNFWWLLRGANTSKGAPSSYNNILFSAGIMGASYALAQIFPSIVEGADAGVSPAMATLGGALIVLGARTAGGCTSGHGISGISIFSTSSYLTIGPAFAAAMLLAPYFQK